MKTTLFTRPKLLWASGIITICLLATGAFFYYQLNSCIYKREPKHTVSGWPFRTNGEIFSYPRTNRKHLFFASLNGNFYCIDKNTGNLHWTYYDCRGVNSFVLKNDNVIISIQGTLVSLAQKDGKVNWSKFVSFFPVTIGLWDNDIICSGYDHLSLISTSSGKNLNSYNFKGQDGYFATKGNTLFISSYNIDSKDYVGHGQVYSFNKLKADPIWVTKLGGSSLGTLTVDENFCYLGARDSKIYALDVVNGKVAWSINTKNVFSNSGLDNIGISPIWADDHVLDLGKSIAFSISHQNIGYPGAIVIVEKSTGGIESKWFHNQSFCGKFISNGTHLVCVTEDRKLLFYNLKAKSEEAKVISLPEGNRGEFSGVTNDNGILYVSGGDGCVYRMDQSELPF
jgi:outer membrane protein assembly factor BamB